MSNKDPAAEFLRNGAAFQNDDLITVFRRPHVVGDGQTPTLIAGEGGAVFSGDRLIAIRQFDEKKQIQNRNDTLLRVIPVLYG